MRFVARYVDAKGAQVVERRLEATSRQHVLQELEAGGHTPILVREDRRWSPFGRRPLDLRTFAIEFRSLLMAGLGVVGALEALAAAQRDDENRRVVMAVLDQVRAGKPLSTGLEASERLFPPLFRAAVRAGESSARLPDALSRFAQYLDVMARLQQSVVSAAIYPLFVAGFGALVLLFLLGYVVPRFAVAYEALPSNVGAPGLLLGTARFVAEQFQLVLLAGIAASWGLWRWFADPRHRAALTGRLLRIGPMADTVRAFHFARLYRSMSMMLDGGYTVPASLRLAMEVLRGTPWIDPLERVARRVDAGKALGESLAEAGFTNEITSRLVIAGDRSAQLAAMFDFAAEHYERELALRVDRAARVLEPALLIVVAGAIGLIVLLMYMPIFDLATALG